MLTKSSLPILDGRLLNGSIEQRRMFSEQLINLCQQVGYFYLSQHSISTTLCKQILEKSRELFALPRTNKSKIHIRLSPHFRGYSEMKNERDWREQFHLGLEEPAIYCEPDAIEYRKLQGPNLWLLQLGQDWQDTMLSFLNAVGTLSQTILSNLAWTLGLPENYFTMLADEPPYLLMKLLCYHPQVKEQTLRVGVAPHCDWSWMTFLLQDDIGGLQIKRPNGDWVDADPIPNTFIVNLGELLEILTGGYLKATPHRVINKSSTHSRIAVPIFINPALTARIAPLQGFHKYRTTSDLQPYIEHEHIHRVVNPRQPIQPFVFGDSEWKRKGQGCWCYNEACYHSVS